MLDNMIIFICRLHRILYCVICNNKLVLLCHRVSCDGVATDDENIEAVNLIGREIKGIIGIIYKYIYAILT